MNKKLLYKTSRAYLTYSVLVVLIAAPFFYYAIQKLYIEEADDTLLLHKKEFIKYQLPVLQIKDIAVWNSFNRNAKIDSVASLIGDTIFSTHYYDTLDAEDEPYRELKAPVTIQNKPYTYIAKINLVETEDLMQSIVLLFLIILVLLLTGLFIITKSLSAKLWKPFYKTLNDIESFELDKNNPPVLSETNTEEFNRLNTSINKLIEKNTLIYKNQREFVENAAHELQTPLAVFQSKIDVLMQLPDNSEEQFEMLNSLNKSVSRLGRLNKNLLLLSMIENDTYSDRHPIILNELIKKNLDFFSEQAVAKNITIELKLEEDIETNSNITLTEILISNLFFNAIRHNISGGKIIIETKNNTLTFYNTATAQSLNTGKLFQRFYKADSSSGGTGLGLSIIKKIIDINGWKARYLYSNNLHSFSVKF